MNVSPGKCRRAVTLLELLVVIAIIGLLVTLLMPAIHAARESARRANCQSNLRQLAIAAQNYESARQSFPSGSISQAYAAERTTPHTFFRWSVLAQLTPYLEQTSAYNALDLSVPLYGRNFQVFPQNEQGVKLLVPEFLCPSDVGRPVSLQFGPTNYAACSGTGVRGGTPLDSDGVFYTNSEMRSRQVKDGLSKTAAFSESILGREVARQTLRSDADPRFAYVFARSAPLTESSCQNSAFWNYTELRGFAWVNGEYRSALYNHHDRPNGAEFDCVSAQTTGPLTTLYTAYGWRAARSLHPGGVNLVTLDGATRFISDDIALGVWQAMATRSGHDSVAAP